MSGRVRLVLISLALACSATALAIIHRHDRDDAAYLKLGDKCPAVTRLSGGTATLVDPQWLITAGHVVAGLSPFDRAVEFRGQRYPIDGVIKHPKWLAKSGPRSVDIGLVKLAQPVSGIVPAAIYTRGDEAGMQVLFVGPGQFGDGLTGPQGDDGKWRGATNIVNGTLDNWITFKFDAPPDGTDLEGISGPGDSGGPALLEADGKLFIIGVSSANDDDGAEGPCRYNSTEYYARVSTVADWIRDTIRAGTVERIAAGEAGDLRTDKWPDTDAGRIAAAFFAAYAKADGESMAAFERAHRAPAALQKRPVEQRVESWRQYRREWGKLRAANYAVAADGTLHVLARAEGEGVWKRFTFELERESPHKLLGIAIVSPAAAPD